MKDKQGRPYAKLSELRVGDKVQVDGDFTCMKPWSIRTVQADGEGDLYLSCSHGGHYLADQVTSHPPGYLMGIYKR